MECTRPALLTRVKDRGDKHAWTDFVSIYRSIVTRYGMAHGLPAKQAENLAEDCIAALAALVTGPTYDGTCHGVKRWLRGLLQKRVQVATQMIGLFLILGAFVFITYQDALRLWG